MKILLVNGPNLNILGIREPEKYGKITLKEIEENIINIATKHQIKIKAFQSNNEGDIVSFIQKEGLDADGMLINAGAYTHTSIAIRDAILSVRLPFVEIHISNIFSREPFRHNSYLSDIAIGIISGFGDYSYELGLYAIINYLNKNK